MSPSSEQLQPGRQGQVAAAALAGDDDTGGVDAELRRIGMDPLQARDTVIKAGWIGCDLRGRRRASTALRKSTMATATP